MKRIVVTIVVLSATTAGLRGIVPSANVPPARAERGGQSARAAGVASESGMAVKVERHDDADQWRSSYDVSGGGDATTRNASPIIASPQVESMRADARGIGTCFEPGPLESPSASPLWESGCGGQPDSGPIHSVYLFNGEFHHSVVDLRIRGRGLDFVWARKYRSRCGPSTAMGAGWDYSYNVFIEQSGADVILHDGNSRSDRYVLQPNGKWARDEFFREIAYDDVNDEFRVVFADNGTWLFRSLNAAVAPGKLRQIRDRNHNSIHLGYDALGRLETITDTFGRAVTVGYDAAGLISSLTDSIGRQVVYTHDAHGDLRTVRSPIVSGTPNGNDFPAGKTTAYTYSSGFADPRLNHNLLTITDANGQTWLVNSYAVTENPADLDFDRVVGQQWGNPGQNVGVAYSVQTPPGESSSAAVIKAAVTDRNGNVKHYYYDALNRLVVARELTRGLRPGEPAFWETRWDYNADSLPTLVTHPNLNSTARTYELDLNSAADRRSRGNLRQLTRHAGPLGGDQASITESFTYQTGFGGCGCGSNFVVSHTDGRGNTTTHMYDGNGNRTRTTHPAGGGVEDWTYNAYGRMTSHTLPANGSGHRRVDSYSYHAVGPEAGAGYLQTKTVDSGGFNLATHYTYDAVGNMLTRTDPRENVESFTYNQLDQIVRRLTPPAGGSQSIAHWNWYDGNDNLVRDDVENRNETGALGANAHLTTIREYDVLNQECFRCMERADASPFGTACADFGPGQAVTEASQFDGNQNRSARLSPVAVNGQQPTNRTDTVYDERNLQFRAVRAQGTSLQSTTQHDYDGNGNIIAVRRGLESSPRVTTYTYDGYDRLKTITDPMGNVTTYTYDANGNRTSVRVDGELVDVPGSAGNVRLSETTFTYDAMDRLVREDTAFFDTQTQAPIGDGVASRMRTFADNSLVTSVRDDNGNLTGTVYDTANRRSTVTDARGNTLTYTYDPNSNVIQIVAVELSDLGLPAEVFTTLYVHDNLNRLIQSVDNIGNVTDYAYDSRGNLVRIVNAENHESRRTYDGLNRLSQDIRDLNGNGADPGDTTDIVIGIEWDDNSRVTARTDDNGHATAEAFDALDRSSGFDFADCTTNSTTYDVHGNRTSTIDERGTVTTYTYDLLDRLIGKIIVPGPGVAFGTTFEAYEYDGLSRLVRAEDNDSIVTRRYNSLSRVTRETQQLTQPPGPVRTVIAEYDGERNQTSCTYPGGRTVTTTYDALNRKKVISDSVVGLVATYDYVGPGRVERRTHGNGTVCDYQYDGLPATQPPGDFGVRRIVRTTHRLGGLIIDDRSYAWDRVGNKVERRDLRAGGPRLAHAYGFDAANRLIHTVVQDATPATVRDTVYVLDGVGNRLSVSGPGTPDAGAYTMAAGCPPADAEMNQYTTTPVGGVAYDDGGNISCGLCEAGDFTFDGRVTTADIPPFVSRLVQGTPASACRDPNDDATWNGRDIQPFVACLLTGVCGGGCWLTYGFDVSNRLVSVFDPGTGRLTRYAYDALGRRMARITTIQGQPGGPQVTQFVSDGWREIEEHDPAPSVVTSYVHGNDLDEVLLMHRAGQVYYYHQDDMFSVMAVTAGDGTAVERYEYHDFGQPSWFSGDDAPLAQSAIGNPWLFHGRRFDTELGWYDYRMRHMNPRTGRFVSRDPIGIWGDPASLGGGQTAFGDNPTSSRDPFGLAVGVCGPDVTDALARVPAALEDLYRGGNIQQQVAQCAFGAEQFDIKPLKHHSGGVANGERLVKSDSPCQKNDKAGDRDQCENTVTLGGRCFYAGTVNYAAYGFIQRICYNNMTDFGKWAYSEEGIRNIISQNIWMYKGPGNWIWGRATAANLAPATDMALAAFDVANNGTFAVPAEERTQCRPCEEKWSGKFYGNWVIWEWAVK